MCGEGMDVWALGVQNRGAGSVIAPNMGDHLDCEECGMCIDVCPVGALTSGSYRYKTRPWEMNHVATVCAHCGDGCKTTLGIRSDNEGTQIVRADNRDMNGLNGDFLCAKGRFGFDFANREDRLTQPLVRQQDGKLAPVSWEHAYQFIAKKLLEIRNSSGGKSIGVIGSNRTTNEENYLLQKFARTVLQTPNIDHHRTADYAGFAQALAANNAATASLRDFESTPAMLVIGSDPTEQHPLLAWNIRTNVRINAARLYIANSSEIKLKRQAKQFLHLQGEDAYAGFAASLKAPAGDSKAFVEALQAEEQLVVALGPELLDGTLAPIIASFPKAKFCLLGDYSNSRGAADMGLYPDLLPGYQPAPEKGLNLLQMLDAASNGQLAALYVVGSNPVSRYNVAPEPLSKTFLIVQDLFLTETAAVADVVLPAASAYEKSGSMTNTYGDLQLVKKAADRAGTRADLEIIVRIAAAMGAKVPDLVPYGSATRSDLGQTRGAQSGEADRHAVWLSANNLEPRTSPFDPNAVLDEIHRTVPGYADLLRLTLAAGTDQHLPAPPSGTLVNIDLSSHASLVLPSRDGLTASGTLGNYCELLGAIDAHESKSAAAVAGATA
jgi:NADH-quinone oxidoreductase subunit G